MNLLLLCMNYAPERTGIALFTTDLAEYLVQQGHGVTVATTFPHYPEWQVQPGYRGKWHMHESRNGVQIYRRAIFLPKRASTAQRVLYDTTLGATALWTGVRAPKFDLVLAVEPPIQAGLAARLLAQWRRVPYALWVQDLALEAAMSVGMMEASWGLKVGRRLEQISHARAKKIIVISRGFEDNLQRKGIPEDKLLCLPNWIDANALTLAESGNGFRQRFGIAADARLVLHTGNMGVKQQLQNVLRAAECLRAQSEIVFALVGDGSQKGMLLDAAQRAHLDNVHFIPLQPRQELPHMLASADIFLLNQHPDLVEAVIPSKLLTYMAAARPIVIAAHPASEAAVQVQQARCGIRVAPDEPNALAQAILQLAADAQTRQLLGKQGRAFVEQNFAREKLLAAYHTVLLDCLN